MTTKIKYLTNKDILKEIHRSKTSFCSFVEKEYHQYDIILGDVDLSLDDCLNLITEDTIQEAKENCASRMGKAAQEAAIAETGKKLPAKDFEVDPATINTNDLIFRIMTFDHIPLAPGRKKTVKTVADKHEKINFPPFQHWKFDEDDTLVCVGKSHWKGDIADGKFSKTHGKMTEQLGRMFIKLCERYATRGNVRGYTYNDEMRGQAILQLAQIGLQFDESKSNNPFAYYTAAVTNSFVRIINIEKRNQVIRDDILEMNGLNPSWTRQNEGSFKIPEAGSDSDD